MTPKTFWTVVAAFGGIQAVVSGVVGWIGALWLKRVEQRLQSSIDRALYAHQVQFREEVDVYKQLWPRLCDVRDAVHDITLHDIGAGKAAAQLDEKQRNYEGAAQALRQYVDRTRPFFAASIAAQLFSLLELMEDERKRDAKQREERASIAIPHVQGFRNLREIAFATNSICEAIRLRLTGAAVPKAGTA